MTFSTQFLSALVYGSLAWCAVTALGLGTLLIRDIVRGEIW
ncbi:hypothetical protein [Novosphingobium mathurense]|uniref:Uncharacterized protein n=1 Tax=Novosphingobium mathurense TaxID=428990 RepID=A0A1U6HL53_9SPHN|nr:hypothetical protein [Novosphingobium mathurense]SLJ96525.1 hypothetical protein SAMN06295987_102689 [Novosphingobium mathurense]